MDRLAPHGRLWLSWQPLPLWGGGGGWCQQHCLASSVSASAWRVQCVAVMDRSESAALRWSSATKSLLILTAKQRSIVLLGGVLFLFFFWRERNLILFVLSWCFDFFILFSHHGLKLLTWRCKTLQQVTTETRNSLWVLHDWTAPTMMFMGCFSSREKKTPKTLLWPLFLNEGLFGRYGSEQGRVAPELLSCFHGMCKPSHCEVETAPTVRKVCFSPRMEICCYRCHGYGSSCHYNCSPD